MTACTSIAFVLSIVTAAIEQGECAARYREAIAEYKESLQAAKGDQQKRSRASQDFHRKLGSILHLANGSDDELSGADLLAIAESAERLKQEETSVNFARRASKRNRDMPTYLCLARCLCKMGYMDEAESSVQEAMGNCKGEDGIQVLHSLLASKYRSLNQSDRALLHLQESLAVMVAERSRNPLYLDFFRQLLLESGDLAKSLDRRDEFALAVGEWRVSIGCDLADAHRSVSKDPTEVAALDAIQKARTCSLLGIALDECSDTGRVEADICDWVDIVARTHGVVSNDAWYGSIDEVLKVVPASLSPSCAGGELHLRLVQVLKLLDLKSIDEGSHRMSRTRAMCVAVITLVKQHSSQQAVVGKELLTTAELQRLVEASSDGPVLIHIVDPLSRSVSSGLLAVKVMGKPGSGMMVVYAACETGLAFDEALSKFVRRENTSNDAEQFALDKVAVALRLSSKIKLLARQSKAWQSLNISIYPVNVLIGKDGRVIGIATGSEPSKLRQLKAIANSDNL